MSEARVLNLEKFARLLLRGWNKVHADSDSDYRQLARETTITWNND